MTRISAVAVHDDLSSRQSAVSLRASDNETPRRIDEKLSLLIDHVSRYYRVKYILFNILVNLFLADCLVVLGG